MKARFSVLSPPNGSSSSSACSAGIPPDRVICKQVSLGHMPNKNNHSASIVESVCEASRKMQTGYTDCQTESLDRNHDPEELWKFFLDGVVVVEAVGDVH